MSLRLLGLLCCLPLAGACARGAPERIVLIVVDTLRADHVDTDPNGTRTPELAALAARGRVLDTMVASFHNTSMSMGSLFTGRSPSLESGSAQTPLSWVPNTWCGLARFATPGQGERVCVPESLPVLGELMRERGYWTIGIVSNALLFRPYGFDRGFADWVEVGEARPLKALRMKPDELSALRAADVVNAAALAAVDRRESDHFFLYVHYMDVHDWHSVPGRSYADAVSAVDAGVGDLLTGLEARGLLEQAAVVFTSDHGEALEEEHLLPTTLRHAGNPSFEPVLRVPLIVTGTDAPLAGPLVRTEDLFRLLARIAGASPGAASELAPGESLVSERLYQTYRDGRFKSFRRRSDGAFHLVDLGSDPQERHDVTEAHPEVAAAHRARLDALTSQLAAEAGPRATLDERDAHRLRILGYLE
jgi:arylsulfatase A-like enzyme